MDGTHWDNNIFSRSIFNKFIHKNQLKRNKLINQIHEWDLFYNKIYFCSFQTCQQITQKLQK